ncbi:MAG: hypothetical protein AB1798_10205 [Spirochaetota bacterium]
MNKEILIQNGYTILSLAFILAYMTKDFLTVGYLFISWLLFTVASVIKKSPGLTTRKNKFVPLVIIIAILIVGSAYLLGYLFSYVTYIIIRGKIQVITLMAVYIFLLIIIEGYVLLWDIILKRKA